MDLHWFLGRKYRWLLACVLLVSIIRIGIYGYIGFAGIGEYSFAQYFPIFVNILMYFSIGKYVFDFFQKGREVTIESMLIRYSASMVALLMTFRNGSNFLFFTTAIVLLIVPYLAGSLPHPKNPKRVFVLMLLVLVLVIGIAVFGMINLGEACNHPAGRHFALLEICNPAVQWLQFTMIVVARGIYETVERGNHP